MANPIPHPTGIHRYQSFGIMTAIVTAMTMPIEAPSTTGKNQREDITPGFLRVFIFSALSLEPGVSSPSTGTLFSLFTPSP